MVVSGCVVAGVHRCPSALTMSHMASIHALCIVPSLWIWAGPVTQFWHVDYGGSSVVWFSRLGKNLCSSPQGILECLLLEPRWHTVRHSSHMERSHVFLWSPAPAEVPADGQRHLLGMWVSHLGCPTQSRLQLTQPSNQLTITTSESPKRKLHSWAPWPRRTMRDSKLLLKPLSFGIFVTHQSLTGTEYKSSIS